MLITTNASTVGKMTIFDVTIAINTDLSIVGNLQIKYLHCKNLKEMTSEQRGLNWFFWYTFSLYVISELNNSNNFHSLYTANFFLNWRVVLRSRLLYFLKAYSSIICLQTHLTIKQFISHLLDLIQATRSKI